MKKNIWKIENGLAEIVDTLGEEPKVRIIAVEMDTIKISKIGVNDFFGMVKEYAEVCKARYPGKEAQFEQIITAIEDMNK